MSNVEKASWDVAIKRTGSPDKQVQDTKSLYAHDIYSAIFSSIKDVLDKKPASEVNRNAPPPQDAPPPAAPSPADTSPKKGEMTFQQATGITDHAIEQAKANIAKRSYHTTPDKLTAGGVLNEVVNKDGHMFRPKEYLKQLSSEMRAMLKDKIGDYDKDVNAAIKVVALLEKTDAANTGKVDVKIDGFAKDGSAAKGSEAAALTEALDNMKSAPVTTGAGKEVDDVINQSPVLQEQVREFLNKGGKFELKDLEGNTVGRNVRKTGSEDPGTIFLDPQSKDAKVMVGVLAHEMGHALDSDNGKSPGNTDADRMRYKEAKGNFNMALIEDDLVSHGVELPAGGYLNDVQRQAFKQFKIDGDKEACIHKIQEDMKNHGVGENKS
jgi:hypothetical protein